MDEIKDKTKSFPWDSAAYLEGDEDIANYLEAVFEDGDPALITHAFGVVARAMTSVRVAVVRGDRNAGLDLRAPGFYPIGLT